MWRSVSGLTERLGQSDEEGCGPSRSAQWASAAELSVKNGDVQALRGLLRGDGHGPAADIYSGRAAMSFSALQDKLLELDPLHMACAKGQREMVRFLLTEVAPWSVMVHDKQEGSTALHTCARFGHADIARDLLGSSALICARDRGDCTALHIACEHDKEEMVRMFLGAGAAVNARDKNGCTPLFTSVRAGGSTNVLRQLIAWGAQVDAAPDGEPTALILAAGMGCLATVRLLARSGAFLLAAADNLGGETALHLAAKNGSENVLRFLLAAGCWAETKDTDHRTPLASACAGGRIGTAAMLLSGIGWGLENVPEDVPPDLRRHVLSFLVASPNTPDRNGNTALLAACENRGTPAVLELLASHGADAACTNHLGETALHVACRRGNAELAQYILDRESSARAAACSDAAPETSSVGATDARGRRPGEVRDIDVGVHEALAVRQVVGTECGRSM